MVADARPIRHRPTIARTPIQQPGELSTVGGGGVHSRHAQPGTPDGRSSGHRSRHALAQPGATRLIAVSCSDCAPITDDDDRPDLLLAGFHVGAARADCEEGDGADVAGPDALLLGLDVELGLLEHDHDDLRCHCRTPPAGHRVDVAGSAEECGVHV